MFANRKEKVELLEALVVSDKNATTPNYVYSQVCPTSSYSFSFFYACDGLEDFFKLLTLIHFNSLSAFGFFKTHYWSNLIWWINVGKLPKIRVNNLFQRRIHIFKFMSSYNELKLIYNDTRFQAKSSYIVFNKFFSTK